MLAPVVVGMRLPILAAEAMGELAAPRPESTRAVSEKLAAMGEGLVAAQLAWIGGMALLPLEVARSASPMKPLNDLAESVTMAALKPVGRTVRRNHRRLSRKK